MQLAQINIGRLLAPLDHPQISDFVRQLDEVNQLAESSPGFVWRLQSDSGNATDIAYSDDPLIIVNMSVWESIEALTEFVYRSPHVNVFRQRRDWFEPHTAAPACLWWVPAGHKPTVAEGKERLEHYRAHGPTENAFWFSKPFPAPE